MKDIIGDTEKFLDQPVSDNKTELDMVKKLRGRNFTYDTKEKFWDSKFFIEHQEIY